MRRYRDRTLAQRREGDPCALLCGRTGIANLSGFKLCRECLLAVARITREAAERAEAIKAVYSDPALASLYGEPCQE